MKTSQNKVQKRIALGFMIAALLAAIVAMGTLMAGADSFYTIRVDYVYRDGTPAHDPFIAVYPAQDFSDPTTEPIEISITNPVIPGYTAVENPDGGGEASTLSFTFNEANPLDHDVTRTIYYIAGLTPYKVRYYKQNIYDDLYTEDTTLPDYLTDRYGYTGTVPEGLDTPIDEDTDELYSSFVGFTSLFNDVNAIAADNSTEYRVYFDRKYYTVSFNLGVGGYGVEPIYAKYQSSYHISEPKRPSFTFRGWLRTNEDGSVYYDEDGNVLDKSIPNILLEKAFPMTTGVIPAEDTYYVAVWEPCYTSFNVVYWLENADSELTPASYNGLNDDQARELLADNYSVVARKTVTSYLTYYDDIGYIETPVSPNDSVDANTMTRNAAGNPISILDFFSYNLNYADPDNPLNTNPDAVGYDPNVKYDKDGNEIDFPDISQGKSEELAGHAKYYVMNTEEVTGSTFYTAETSKTVSGDGTTRINVYFSRKVFTLKFYYAREGLTNGQPNGNVSLTNSTKSFSEQNYLGSSSPSDYRSALAQGTWSTNIALSRPKIAEQYRGILTPSAEDEDGSYVTYGSFCYWYYEIQAKYGAPLRDKWLIDAITPVEKRYDNNPDDGIQEICYPASWAVEYGTKYFDDHSKLRNYTIKGIYEKLGDDLMFTNGNSNYTELHYLLSWANTSVSGVSGISSNSWNNDHTKVLTFIYENYIELLPNEIEYMQLHQTEGDPTGVEALEAVSDYVDIKQRSFTKEDGETVTKWYGLTTENRISTTDSGDQYPRDSGGTNRTNTRNMAVRFNQTASDMTGCEIEYKRVVPESKEAYIWVNGASSGTLIDSYKDHKGYIEGVTILDDCNTEIDWSEDTANVRRATVKFFYKRIEYTLQYQNGGITETDHTRRVMYGSPINATYLTDDTEGHTAGEYRYYFADPVYYITDLDDYHTFKGWYYTPLYHRQMDLDTMTMPADDLVVYAKWESKKIGVSFYNDYDDYYLQVNTPEGETPARPASKADIPFPLNRIEVDYGDYIEAREIPIDYKEDPGASAPDHVLYPPSEGAMFAGWYYISDRRAVRYDPQEVAVTSLNRETQEDGELRLFAEWVTKDVAKYKVTYVEQGNPEVEVAPATVGNSYVWKTKTFTAKGGSDLNSEHSYAEDSRNWWPTVSSHSIVIKANRQGEMYAPNEYTFEYIQKSGVYYKVQYLDADSRAPLPGVEEKISYTTHASVKEDARFIPGYVVTEASQALVLSASTAATAEEQREEELENNVIVFLYEENTTEYLYEAEYYVQNIDDDDYSLSYSESLMMPIADPGPTTVTVSDLYSSQYAEILISNGYSLKNGASQTAVTEDETTTVSPAADDAEITITGEVKTTIRLYFDRRTFGYTYQYIDYYQENRYNEALAGGEDVTGMWDGLLETHTGDSPRRVGKEIVIPKPLELTYSETRYEPLSDAPVTLTIRNADNDSDINVVKVYYKNEGARELKFQLVCVNESDSNAIVDYDEATGDPLYGGLSRTLQEVADAAEVLPVQFYNYNDATYVSDSGETLYKHLHRYTFLGWYSQPERGENDAYRIHEGELLPTDKILSGGELPSSNTTYYALVEEDMVTLNVEFRYIDEALPDDNATAAAIVSAAPADTTGRMTGSRVRFDNPSGYMNNSSVPWHRNDGYTFEIVPIDNRVYKYEFTEWWEQLTDGTLIRKDDLNYSEWGNPERIEGQFTRQQDQHIIAVFKKRTVTEMPYIINYVFNTRTNGTKALTVEGTLDLTDAAEAGCINEAGAFELTDEFILSRAPYESNHGEVISWSDRADCVFKSSEKGDGETTVDHIITTVTAIQQTKIVTANYRTSPDGAYTQISVPIGSNYGTASAMRAICAAESYEDRAFSHWEVRKTSSDTAPVTAKSYKLLFDLCMLDNYWITPVYGGSGENTATPTVTLTRIDFSRNRWTDSGVEPRTGSTDLLYTDFEIAFEDGIEEIYLSDGYEAGVVFELCASMPADSSFDPDRDYGMVSDPTALHAAITSALAANKTSGSYYYDTNYPTRKRSYQLSVISTAELSNHDRVNFAKGYKNAYKIDAEGAIQYTNSNYLMKATAYLKKDNTVTLSNSVYLCLKDEAQKELAIGNMPAESAGD